MLVGAEWIAVPLDRKSWRVATVAAVDRGLVSRISSLSGGGPERAAVDIVVRVSAMEARQGSDAMMQPMKK